MQKRQWFRFVNNKCRGSENFGLSDNVCLEMRNLKLKTPHFRGNLGPRGKINILSTRYLFCRKFAASYFLKFKTPLASRVVQEKKYRYAARHYSRVVDYLLEEDQLIGDEKRKRDTLMLSAYLNAAKCHLELGNNLDVVRNCEKALAMNTRSEKALYRRATVRTIISHVYLTFSISGLARNANCGGWLASFSPFVSSFPFSFHPKLLPSLFLEVRPPNLSYGTGESCELPQQGLELSCSQNLT